MYRYFFNLCPQKESVSFGTYSNNWTAMNLKTNKLILLEMIMANSNKIMMKIIPIKIINLKLFASIIINIINTYY